MERLLPPTCLNRTIFQGHIIEFLLVGLVTMLGSACVLRTFQSLDSIIYIVTRVQYINLKK